MVSFFTSKGNQILGVLSLCSIYFSSYAQVSDYYFQANFVTGFSKSKTLNAIVDSYNAQNSATLTKAMKNPTLTYGYELQFDWRVSDHLFCAGGLTNAVSKSEAKFENNAERHLFLRANYINGLIGYSTGDYNELTIYTGIAANFSLVNSYVKYTTGDKDHIYGQLGGSYSSVGFGIPIGAQIAKRISPNFQLLVKLQIQALRATKFTYINNTRIDGISSSSLIYGDIEALDDTKRFLFSVGLRYQI